MTRADLTEKILDIKREKGWSWKYIHEKIGGTSPVLLVGARLDQMKPRWPRPCSRASRPWWSSASWVGSAAPTPAQSEREKKRAQPHRCAFLPL
jgi:cyanate lyase